MDYSKFIEIDPSTDDGYSSSSGYETDGTESSILSTATLKSSIYDYRFENGRRYHAYRDGKYMLPNDDAEQERLDIIHHTLLLLLDNRLHLAPIGPNPTRILDIGTGTGIWAIDAGDRYPSAEVIGTDLSPIQPGWVPPNVYFQIDDAESEWTFAKDSFDLIHIRHLSGSIKDWGALIEQAYKHLKPGGYIDICELEMHLSSDDGTSHPGLDLSKYCELLNKAATVLGQDFETITKLKPLIERAGFVNVRHEKMKLPLGTWPVDPKQKIIGGYILITVESGFEACGLRLLTCVLDMDQASFAVLTERAKRDAYDRSIHGYSWQHFYYGMRPLDPTS